MAILTVPRDEDLDAFVAAYDLGERRESRGIEAGTVNTSYALDLESGRYFLRLYEEQGREGAEAEAGLLLHLAARGVATPPPVRARDGAMVRTLAGKPAVLFPWVDGDMICQRGVTEAHARAVGEALARLHVAGAPPGSPLGAGRFGPADLERRCERVACSRDAEARVLAGELRAAVSEVAARRRTDVPTGLVHGDLFRDNVLWNESRIAALLDFESAHLGPLCFDLAVTILSWSFSAGLDLGIARAITAGYAEVRPLEESEREALYVEAVLAALRFTITRITDDAIRVGKRWQRFVARRQALEALGPVGLRRALAL